MALGNFPGGGSFLCEGFFSSQMEPCDTSRGSPGAGRGAALAGVVGVPPCQVNSSELGSLSPLPQAWIARPTRLGRVPCRTEELSRCPPTHPAGARNPQIPSCVAGTFHLLEGLVSFPSRGPGHVRTNPRPSPPPCHPPLPLQPWGRCHIGFPLSCLGCWTLPREIWPWSVGRMAVPHPQAFSSGEPGGPTLGKDF